MMPSQLCGRGKIWVCFPRFQQYIGMIVEVSELMQLSEQVNLCQQLAHLWNLSIKGILRDFIELFLTCYSCSIQTQKSAQHRLMDSCLWVRTFQLISWVQITFNIVKKLYFNLLLTLNCTGLKSRENRYHSVKGIYAVRLL